MSENWDRYQRRLWLPRAFARQAGMACAAEYLGYEIEDFTEDGWLVLKAEEVDLFDFVVIKRSGVLAANRLSMPHSPDELPEEALSDGIIPPEQMELAERTSREIVQRRWFGIYRWARWLQRTNFERCSW